MVLCFSNLLTRTPCDAVSLILFKSKHNQLLKKLIWSVIICLWNTFLNATLYRIAYKFGLPVFTLFGNWSCTDKYLISNLNIWQQIGFALGTFHALQLGKKISPLVKMFNYKERLRWKWLREATWTPPTPKQFKFKQEVARKQRWIGLSSIPKATKQTKQGAK